MAKVLSLAWSPHSLGQDGHDFVGSAGGDGRAPVVGVGVAEFMQGANSAADGAEAAKEQVADGFGWRCWWRCC
jgi:hypothetical protein